MAMTVPRQNIALLSVLVNQSQAARLNRAQDVSPELVRQLIHRLIVYFYSVPGYEPVTLGRRFRPQMGLSLGLPVADTGLPGCLHTISGTFLLRFRIWLCDGEVKREM